MADHINHGSHTQTDAAGRRFTQTPEGPLGSGRLFQNPNLQTLDELQEAFDDPNRSAQGRRDVSAAFQKFSSFLDRQDAKEARRRFTRQRSEDRELDLQKKRDEAKLRKEISSDPVTSRAQKAFRRASLILGGPRNVPSKVRERLLPKDLQAPADKGFPVQLTEIIGLPTDEFNREIVRLQQDGTIVLTAKQFTAATSANARNQEGQRAEKGLELRKSKDVETRRLNNQRLNLSREREARLTVAADLNASFKGFNVSQEASAEFQKARDDAVARLSKPRLTDEDIEFYEEASGNDPELATEMAREDGFNVPD